jgi:hypothetical protein
MEAPINQPSAMQEPERKKTYDYYGTLQTYDMAMQKYVKQGRVEAYKQFPSGNQPDIKGTVTLADGTKMTIALWNQP